MKGGAALAGRLLDQVPEDGRDGLFLACYRLQSEKLDRKLIEKFTKWGEEGWCLGATDELYALEQFIAKWLGLYPFEDLEGVIRLIARSSGHEARQSEQAIHRPKHKAKGVRRRRRFQAEIDRQGAGQ